MHMYRIGIDLGGTSIAAGLVDGSREGIGELLLPPVRVHVRHQGRFHQRQTDLVPRRAHTVLAVVKHRRARAAVLPSETDLSLLGVSRIQEMFLILSPRPAKLSFCLSSSMILGGSLFAVVYSEGVSGAVPGDYDR